MQIREFYERRAREEREKAALTPCERVREARLEMAAIFEQRASMRMPHLAAARDVATAEGLAAS